MARRAHSLQQLLDEVNAHFPLRDTGSDGWIGDPAHQSRPSDHNPNSAGVVQAQDFDEHTHDQQETVGQTLWDFLLASRDPRIKYVIYEGDMFSSYPAHGHPPFTVRNYTGSNQHLTHLHLSVVDAPARYDDGSPWGFSGTQEDDDMALKRGDSGKRVTALQARLTWWRGEDLEWDGQFGPATEAAVKRWQDKVGLDQDGVWTETEWALLLVNALKNGHIGGNGDSGSHSHEYTIKRPGWEYEGETSTT